MSFRRAVRSAAMLLMASAAAVAVPAFAVDAGCTAALHGKDAAYANHCAKRRADEALAALSARYAEVYARLSASERAAFSARERSWLSADRWQEQRSCVAQRGDAAAAHCLAEVTERRLASL